MREIRRGRRLPRDIHALYHSVINQVLHGRYRIRRTTSRAPTPGCGRDGDAHTGDATGQPRTSPQAAVSYRELEAILADYAGQERASEKGTADVINKREDLISQSGLLLPRIDEKAGFYHLSFQEFLAAERLDILRSDLADCLRRHAAIPEWHRTLMFLFCTVAEDRPQVALDALREVLLPHLTLQALAQDPNPAELLLDCLDIAYARRWSLDEFTGVLQQSCEESLQTKLEPAVRNTIWLAAGRLGVDRRPGVGLGPDDVPQIAWCEVPAGRVILEDCADEFDVGAFSIARYPVTHAQFQAFVNADDGYRNPAWWVDEWLERGWVDPQSPSAAHWCEANAPRERISWHEAVAFCCWLDARLREQGNLASGRQLRLPTEFEWQQAATGGEPERLYPWGPDWAPEALNTDDSIAAHDSGWHLSQRRVAGRRTRHGR